MTKILCAIRGGEASFKTQDAAIDLAFGHSAELLFLFVVDTKFMDKTARAFRRDAVTREMDHMADFLLLMALERAKERGVKSSLLVRHGDFRMEILDLVKDPDIQFLVLGTPAGEESFFSLEELVAFAKEVEATTQTRVIFAELPGSLE